MALMICRHLSNHLKGSLAVVLASFGADFEERNLGDLRQASSRTNVDQARWIELERSSRSFSDEKFTHPLPSFCALIGLANASAM